MYGTVDYVLCLVLSVPLTCHFQLAMVDDLFAFCKYYYSTLNIQLEQQYVYCFNSNILANALLVYQY